MSLPDGLQNQTLLFLNSDSLLSNYNFYHDMRKKFEDKQSQMDMDMKKKGAGLQQEMMQFQQQYGSMTQSQVDAKKEQLAQKEQDLMGLREQLSGELMQEEQKINREIFDRISAFLHRYTAGKNINYILGYTPGGAVLYAKDSLDITAPVLEGLNAEYNH